MPKTTIEDTIGDNGSEQIIPSEIKNRIFNTVTIAFDRLGEAKRLIELIKIAPRTMTDLVQNIAIKMVISYTEPHSGDKIRIERDFEIFIGNGLENLLSQRIVVNFQEALAEKATSFRRIEEDFRKTLGLLGFNEHESGNDKRCRTCGTMREHPLSDESFVCPKCRPDLMAEIRATCINPPSCPSCGHVTVLNGNGYKCLNCGESLGLQYAEDLLKPSH